MNPTAAYRRDTAGRREPIGRTDDAWLAIASELHGAALVEPGEARRERFYGVIGLALDLLGEDFIERFSEREWQRDLGYVEALMVLAHVIHEAGALNLAAVMLDDLHRLADDLTAVQAGRILAMRARVEWKLGRHDEALERYQHIESTGKRARAPELVARAVLGYATLAQIRGNLPELRTQARRAAAIADEHGFASVGRIARHGLMLVATRERDYDTALLEGWRAFQASQGDAMQEAEVLQNIGQMLLEAGHFETARASFAAIFDRAPIARVSLPALGGLALASARLAAEPTVEWSVREVWRARDAAVPAYELAAALIECATALAIAGRSDESAAFREAGEALARERGYHELAFRAQAMDAVHSPRPFAGRAQSIASIISAMEPDDLPDHVTFEHTGGVG